MGSRRLPGKSLRVLHDKPVAEWCYGQCKKATGVDNIIFAIPDNEEDHLLFEYLSGKRMKVFRGDGLNLVKRYYQCAREYGLDVIVRITGDNPLVDPDTISRALELHLREKSDYTSTRIWDEKNKKIVNNTAKGLSVDIFNYNALEEMVSTRDLDDLEKEHIIYFFFRRREQYKICSLQQECKLDFCFSIDNEEDASNIEQLFAYFGIHDLEFNMENYSYYVNRVLKADLFGHLPSGK